MNYLPQAMALLESSRKVYPDVDFYVLIIDGTSKEVPHLPTAHILLPEDLIIAPEWLVQMRSYYDEMELATSLKPFLLKTLLDYDIETVTYLDPDILLFGELTEGINVARDFGIALTPHRLTPSNILEPSFSELDFLRYGIFNLGYIAVGQSSKEMLDWWGSRLRWYCTKFPNDPSFTDQKWINFVPALFNFGCVKSKGYNLASWNLDERPLSLSGESYLAGADALVFIHFAQMSGVLAAGKETDHWKLPLNSNDEQLTSLQIVKDITSGYSQKLVKNRMALEKVNTRETTGFGISGHRKRILITESVAEARDASEGSMKALKATRKVRFEDFFKLLEKSSSLNGFRDGLVIDKTKFGKLIRRILAR